jgi:hypothetical protein
MTGAAGSGVELLSLVVYVYIGITSRGDTGLRESLTVGWVRAGRSWGDDGGVDGSLKGRVTSSATDDGVEELVWRTGLQDWQSAHRVPDPSVWSQQQLSKVVSSCSILMGC